MLFLQSIVNNTCIGIYMGQNERSGTTNFGDKYPKDVWYEELNYQINNLYEVYGIVRESQVILTKRLRNLVRLQLLSLVVLLCNLGLIFYTNLP